MSKKYGACPACLQFGPIEEFDTKGYHIECTDPIDARYEMFLTGESTWVPKILIPYTGDTPDELQINVLQSYGYTDTDIRLRNVKGQDLAYSAAVKKCWTEGTTFIVLEHDIVPWPTALALLAECPHSVCAYPYLMKNAYMAALGCTKFSSEVCQLDPWKFIDLPPWWRLDGRLLTWLRMHGHPLHIHFPPVTHLNFDHAF